MAFCEPRFSVPMEMPRSAALMVIQTSPSDMPRETLRLASKQQLAALGVSHIAYVKPVMVNGVQGFAIHAADGTPMAVTGNREVAVAAVMQHEMLPLSVH